MGQLISDVTRALLGVGTDFSFVVWAFVTIMLASLGPMFVQVAPRLYGPPARAIAAEPARTITWTISWIVILLFTTLLAMALAIVAAPVLLLLLGWTMAAGFIGYFALAWLIGEQTLIKVRTLESAPPAWLATLVGILVIRLLRLVPIAGGVFHAMIVLVGFGAVSAMAWRYALAWHRRRMPDADQFAGETLVEWYPDGDPEDGRASVQTGRPVIGNVRGDEDRAPVEDDE